VEIIKNKIRVYRAINDMTQEDLANRVRVTRQTIIAIEKNRYMPSLRLAFRIARVFDQPIEEVFFYEE